MRGTDGREASGTIGIQAVGDDPVPPWMPSFARDPILWLEAVRRWRLGPTWLRVVAELEPGEWVSASGHRWRLVRTMRGIEVRPDLVSPFLQVGALPIVTALGIGQAVEVELTTSAYRWVDAFAPSELDFAALGRTMLEERALPHDNLPLLFPSSAPVR